MEQKLHILKASLFEIFPLSNNSAVIFAPTGYPDIMLVKNTREEDAGVLKSF